MNIKTSTGTSKEGSSGSESKNMLTRRGVIKGIFLVCVVTFLPACGKDNGRNTSTRVPESPVRKTVLPDIELNKSQKPTDGSEITKTPDASVGDTTKKDLVTPTPVAGIDNDNVTNASENYTEAPKLSEREEFASLTEYLKDAENVIVEKDATKKSTFSLFVSGIEEKQPNLADSEKTSIMKIVRSVIATTNIAYMGIQSGDFLKMIPFNAVGKYKYSMEKALKFALDAGKRIKITTFSGGVFSLFADINLLKRIEPNIDIFAPALKGFLRDSNIESKFGAFLGGFATKEDFFKRVNELYEIMAGDSESPRTLKITIRVGSEDPIVDYDKVKAGIEEAENKGIIRKGVVVLESAMKGIKHSPDQETLKYVILNRMK
ncbi:MAG: hypothetical protein WCO33_02300 [bacterium]